PGDGGRRGARSAPPPPRGAARLAGGVGVNEAAATAQPRTSLGEQVISAALWGAGLTFLATTLPPLTALMRAIPADRLDGLTRAYCRGQLALTLCRWRAHVHADVDPATPY